MCGAICREKVVEQGTGKGTTSLPKAAPEPVPARTAPAAPRRPAAKSPERKASAAALSGRAEPTPEPRVAAKRPSTGLFDDFQNTATQLGVGEGIIDRSRSEDLDGSRSRFPALPPVDAGGVKMADFPDVAGISNRGGGRMTDLEGTMPRPPVMPDPRALPDGTIASLETWRRDLEGNVFDQLLAPFFSTRPEPTASRAPAPVDTGLLDTIRTLSPAFRRRYAPPSVPANGDPRRSVLLVTCSSCRLGTAIEESLGLAPGDAVVVRTAGAVALPSGEGLRSVVLAVLAHRVADVLVVGHDGCTLAGLGLPAAMQALRDLGVPPEAVRGTELGVWFGFAADAADAVRRSVRTIAECPLLPPRVAVHGLLFDSATGALTELVDGRPRAGAGAPIASPAARLDDPERRAS